MYNQCERAGLYSREKELLIFARRAMAQNYTYEQINAATEEWLKQGNNLRIVVIGEMGAGKSTLVNGLIGQNVAVVGSGARSVTKAVTEYTSVISGVTVKVYDTPGLFDPKRNDMDTFKAIERECGSVDLVLICIDFRSRITRSHTTIISNITETYGSKIWDNTMFVLTFANKIELPETLRSQREKILHFKLLHEDYSSTVRRYLVEMARINSRMSKTVPVLPAGHTNPRLPDRDDWLSDIWLAAFEHMLDVGKPAMLRIVRERLTDSTDSTEKEPLYRKIRIMDGIKSVGQFIFKVVTNPTVLQVGLAVTQIILAILKARYA